MAEVRVQHSSCRVGARVVRVATVEAVPAEPEEPGADRNHEQVVRSVDLAVARETRTDHRGRNEAGDAGGEMDHVAAGEVDRALVRPVAAAPDQEGVDRVTEGDPERHEEQPGLEVDPAEHRAEHQDRRDRRKDELEVDERRLREMPGRPGSRAQLRDVGDPFLVHMVEHRPRLADEVAEEAMARKPMPRRAEAHVEGVEHPDDQHRGERSEREHHAVDRPALLHHPAVEHDEARHAHQADEGRRRELP